ncbi:MAG: hypothetical protein CMB77_03715 [Euryarchaeota archaeon]|nr:hypothetical protein [Euryarchaeota archaeon]|tara:strand:- start:30465 stop:30908 length:444 start_codon:yes stop_codon:yes gene_type:complete
MATTVTKTTFTSRILESITINGQQQQVYTMLSIPNVTDYSHRIMSVATTATTLLTLAAADAGGAIDKVRMQYVRLTNLDDANDIQLTFTLTSSHTYEVVLGPKKTHMLTHKQGDVTTGGDVTLEDIVSIKGTASTAASDLEIFTVST